MPRNRRLVPKSVVSQSLAQIMDSTGFPALLKIHTGRQGTQN